LTVNSAVCRRSWWWVDVSPGDRLICEALLVAVASWSVLFLVAPLGLAAAVCWVGVRRARAEPGRLSNAYWLLVGVLLAIQALADLAVPGVDAFLTVLVAAPLQVLCLTAFLILHAVRLLRTAAVSTVGIAAMITAVGLLALVASVAPVLVSGPGWLISALVLVLLAAGYLGFQFVAFLGYTVFYPRLVTRRRADWVVVLGAGDPAAGISGLVASRIRTGLAECRRHGARLLVMSSAERGASASRVDAMVDWAIAQGADPDLLAKESRSGDIAEGLRYSAALATARGPAGDGLVVTSNYQVLRVATSARRLGLSAHVVGAASVGDYWPSAIVGEFVAVLAEHKVAHVVLILLLLLLTSLLAAG
jgi:uncharacterized SAM-binding protein YcdF (DUF218 family)